jgi:hypothetical protein
MELLSTPIFRLILTTTLIVKSSSSQQNETLGESTQLQEIQREYSQ